MELAWPKKVLYTFTISRSLVKAVGAMALFLIIASWLLISSRSIVLPLSAKAAEVSKIIDNSTKIDSGDHSNGPILVPKNAPSAQSNNSRNAKFGHCDLYHGEWIHDPIGPLYTNSTCPILTQSQNCQGNGRPDKDYENWRWKPDQCFIPRFNAQKFLEMMRGKTVAFIGDSVARNQMESMLCILWQVETPKMHGNRRMHRWYFRSTSTTIVRIWSSWLVHKSTDALQSVPQGLFKATGSPSDLSSSSMVRLLAASSGTLKEFRGIKSTA